MNSNEKFWLSIWAIIAVAAMTLFGMGFGYNERVYKDMSAKGYCQTTIIGDERLAWQKCKEQ